MLYIFPCKNCCLFSLSATNSLFSIVQVDVFAPSMISAASCLKKGWFAIEFLPRFWTGNPWAQKAIHRCRRVVCKKHEEQNWHRLFHQPRQESHQKRNRRPSFWLSFSSRTWLYPSFRPVMVHGLNPDFTSWKRQKLIPCGFIPSQDMGDGGDLYNFRWSLSPLIPMVSEVCSVIKRERVSHDFWIWTFGGSFGDRCFW